jgi:hypothetical protein
VGGCIFLGSGFDCGVVKCIKLLCILSYTTCTWHIANPYTPGSILTTYLLLEIFKNTAASDISVPCYTAIGAKGQQSVLCSFVLHVHLTDKVAIWPRQCNMVPIYRLRRHSCQRRSFWQRWDCECVCGCLCGWCLCMCVCR